MDAGICMLYRTIIGAYTQLTDQLTTIQTTLQNIVTSSSQQIPPPSVNTEVVDLLNQIKSTSNADVVNLINQTRSEIINAVSTLKNESYKFTRPSPLLSPIQEEGRRIRFNTEDELEKEKCYMSEETYDLVIDLIRNVIGFTEIPDDVHFEFDTPLNYGEKRYQTILHLHYVLRQHWPRSFIDTLHELIRLLRSTKIFIADHHGTENVDYGTSATVKDPKTPLTIDQIEAEMDSFSKFIVRSVGESDWRE